MAQTKLTDNVVSINANQSSPVGPVLQMLNGRPMVSSRQVADHFGRQHNNVIRSIEAIVRNSPESFGALNFERSEYTDSTGRRLPAYLLTRDGFVIVAMGFTGPKAIKWKIAYIQAFNAMEAELSGRIPTGPVLDGPISAAMQQEIKELVQAKVSAFPDSAKPKVFSQIWTRLQRKFKIPRYSELPVGQFGEARDYVIAMQIRSVDAPDLPMKDDRTVPPTPAWKIYMDDTTMEIMEIDNRLKAVREKMHSKLDAIHYDGHDYPGQRSLHTEFVEMLRKIIGRVESSFERDFLVMVNVGRVIDGWKTLSV
jgi:Rha family phage regulatory protein